MPKGTGREHGARRRRLAELAAHLGDRPFRDGGFKKSALLGHEQEIREWIEADPGLTIRDIGERLAEGGTRTSRAAICRYLPKLDLTRKRKTVRAAEQSREDVAKARDDWRNEQKKLKPEQLIFVDETCDSTNMAPRYSRAAKGKRAEAMVGHCKTTTCIAALRHERIDAPCVFDGPTNGDRCLAPPRPLGRVLFQRSDRRPPDLRWTE